MTKQEKLAFTGTENELEEIRKLLYKNGYSYTPDELAQIAVYNLHKSLKDFFKKSSATEEGEEGNAGLEKILEFNLKKRTKYKADKLEDTATKTVPPKIAEKTPETVEENSSKIKNYTSAEENPSKEENYTSAKDKRKPSGDTQILSAPPSKKDETTLEMER